MAVHVTIDPEHDVIIVNGAEHTFKSFFDKKVKSRIEQQIEKVARLTRNNFFSFRRNRELIRAMEVFQRNKEIHDLVSSDSFKGDDHSKPLIQ